MNWEIIISAIVGMLTGGGVSWLFKLNEEKESSKEDIPNFYLTVKANTYIVNSDAWDNKYDDWV